MQYFNGCNYDKMPFILHQTHRYLFIVYNITDYDGDKFFYGLITLMFRVNPPPMFLRVKFSKKKWGQYTSKYGN
jgi:hypothetical protein